MLFKKTIGLDSITGEPRRMWIENDNTVTPAMNGAVYMVLLDANKQKLTTHSAKGVLTLKVSYLDIQEDIDKGTISLESIQSGSFVVPSFVGLADKLWVELEAGDLGEAAYVEIHVNRWGY
ncbi:hypothetical protein [Vibrio phage YC]|uniref:Uncharacterized protein n=1 Tax=Vibrio phage YC TaxID=2267403 RepID=A0A384ZS45_9CAUD|nr:hypothetical protein HWB64_gp107 [Vibrio phage YC]AXC34476.1 hypothetical protein [Vibrio phage YC]